MVVLGEAQCWGEGRVGALGGGGFAARQSEWPVGTAAQQDGVEQGEGRRVAQAAEEEEKGSGSGGFIA